MKTQVSPIVIQIEKSILMIRGQKVILDQDLAWLYQVSTKVLIQAFKRNSTRFPEDFAFNLTIEEHKVLRSQFVTSSGKTGRRYAPYAFTEQGVAMLSSILHSERAVQVNIEIMRVFVRLRQLVATHDELAKKLAELESRYDKQFQIVFQAIRESILPVPQKQSRKIGFGRD